jgi:hypothetical protein
MYTMDMCANKLECLKTNYCIGFTCGKIGYNGAAGARKTYSYIIP